MLKVFASLPVVVQKAVTDFWTILLGSLAGFTIVLPAQGGWTAFATSLAIAVLGIVVNAIRRAAMNQIIGA